MPLFKFPEVARQKKKGSSAIGSYRFPEDLGQHYMHLTFEEYDYSARKVRGGITPGTKPARNIKDSIALPLAEQLTSISELRIGAEELGALGGAIGTEAYGAVKSMVATLQSAQNLGDIVSSLPGTDAAKNLGQVAAAVAAKNVISTIDPGLQKGLEVGAGYTFNPYQALVFSGINLRQFVFDWTLAPQTRAESDTLQQIITTIRKHIHPEYSGFGDVFGVGTSGRSFLKYPDILNIQILGSPSGYLPVYKPSLISNFTVNYVGGGEIAFLEGGKPAVVKLTMSVQEMEIWTREDYDPSTNPSQEVKPTLSDTTNVNNIGPG